MFPLVCLAILMHDEN